MGFTGVLIPEENGGVGLGVVEAGVIGEELGRTLTPSPFLSTAVMAARALARGGNAEQKARYLAGIASGELVVALAVDESSKHRPSTIATTASRDGAGFVLDGAKAFVVDGHVADALIVAARTRRPTARVGHHPVHRRPEDGGPERRAHLDGRLRTTPRAFGSKAFVSARTRCWAGSTRAARCSRRCSTSAARSSPRSCSEAREEVFGRTVAYLKERKQFGRFIGEFQALQHRAAALYCDIELTRALVLRALQALDENPEAARADRVRRQGAGLAAPRTSRFAKACRCTAAWA